MQKSEWYVFHQTFSEKEMDPKNGALSSIAECVPRCFCDGSSPRAETAVFNDPRVRVTNIQKIKISLLAKARALAGTLFCSRKILRVMSMP